MNKKGIAHVLHLNTIDNLARPQTYGRLIITKLASLELPKIHMTPTQLSNLVSSIYNDITKSAIENVFSDSAHSWAYGIINIYDLNKLTHITEKQDSQVMNHINGILMNSDIIYTNINYFRKSQNNQTSDTTSKVRCLYDFFMKRIRPHDENLEEKIIKFIQSPDSDYIEMQSLLYGSILFNNIISLVNSGVVEYRIKLENITPEPENWERDIVEAYDVLSEEISEYCLMESANMQKVLTDLVSYSKFLKDSFRFKFSSNPNELISTCFKDIIPIFEPIISAD